MKPYYAGTSCNNIQGDMPKWAMPAHTGHAKVRHDAVYENTDCEITIYLQVIKPIDFY